MENILNFFNTDFETIYTSFLDYLPNIFSALLVLILFWAIYIFTRRPIKKILRKAHLDETLIRILVTNLYKSIVFIIGVIMALSKLGINVVAAFAGFGIIGIAVGFAAKDSLSNIIAGFVIFWDKPFRIGEWITVGDKYGKVSDITLRTTRIRTRDNTYVIVPNQSIISEVVTNHSKDGDTRVQVEIGIAYKESIESARKVIIEAVSKIDKVKNDPAPQVVSDGLGDSSVNLLIQVWVNDAEDELGTRYEVVEISKKALDEAGIEIPFPHLQLFLEDIKNKAINKIKGINKI